MKIPSQILRDRIDVEVLAGAGALGPSFHAGRTIHAFLQPTNELTQDQFGQVVQVVAKGAIRPEAGPIPTQSKITLLSTGDTFRVIDCAAVPDAIRPTHWELVLTHWDASRPGLEGSGS